MSRKTCKHCSISFYRPSAGSDIPNDVCSLCHGKLKAADNERDPVNNPSARQIGGDHYSKLAIQPMQYSMANGLNALQHTIIKYVTRYKDKGGIEDLRKAAHCVELLIQHEMGVVGQNGGTAGRCPAADWIPNNGKKPDLPDGTRVDIRFADGQMETVCSASNWVWTQDGESDDITHYRIRQPE